MSIKDHLKIAKNAAYKSPVQNKHGAVVILRGEIVSIGINHYRQCSNKRRTKRGTTVHAEVDALNNCDRNMLRGAILVVVRVEKKTGDCLLSKPCSNCERIIKKMMRRHGLLRVYFS